MEDVTISEWSETWSQPSDCCSSTDTYQSILLESRNNGSGNYFIIRTDGWAINGDEESILAFADMLRKFMLKGS